MPRSIRIADHVNPIHNSPVASIRPPSPGAWHASQNAQENTIARFPSSAYHGDMISRQAPKRPGYMNPAPRLLAALAGGVVAW
jgi:hypothetical protein